MTFSQKCKRYFIPFLGIYITYVAIVALVVWGLILYNPIWGIENGIIKIVFLIAIFPIVPLILFWQSLKGISGVKYNNYKAGLFFIGCWGIVFEGIMIHSIIQESTARITSLNYIGEINSKPVSKYYKCSHFYVDKFHAGSDHGYYQYAGRASHYTSFSVYFAMPIYDSISDTSQTTPMIWFGKEYNKNDNYSHFSESDSLIIDYQKECNSKFDTADYNNFEFLQREGWDSRLKYYKSGMSATGRYNGGSAIILTPVYTPYSQRYRDSIWVTVSVPIICSLIWLIVLYFADVDYG
jgi:hypothetical protein